MAAVPPFASSSSVKCVLLQPLLWIFVLLWPVSLSSFFFLFSIVSGSPALQSRLFCETPQDWFVFLNFHDRFFSRPRENLSPDFWTPTFPISTPRAFFLGATFHRLQTRTEVVVFFFRTPPQAFEPSPPFFFSPLLPSPDL